MQSEHSADVLQVGSVLAGVILPASRLNHHQLRLEGFLPIVLKDVEGLAFGNVIVVTGLGELKQELEDLGRGRTVLLFAYPGGLSNVLLAPTQSKGLAPRVDNRFVVQRVGLAIEHHPVVRVVHQNLGRHHQSRWRPGRVGRPPLRLRTGCEGDLRPEPRVNTTGQLSRPPPASLTPLRARSRLGARVSTPSTVPHGRRRGGSADSTE